MYSRILSQILHSTINTRTHTHVIVAHLKHILVHANNSTQILTHHHMQSPPTIGSAAIGASAYRVAVCDRFATLVSPAADWPIVFHGVGKLQGQGMHVSVHERVLYVVCCVCACSSACCVLVRDTCQPGRRLAHCVQGQGMHVRCVLRTLVLCWVCGLSAQSVRDTC